MNTKTEQPQLSPEAIEAFGAEIDAIRRCLLSRVGASDARYIRRLMSVQRLAELSGRALLFAGVLPPAWVGGVGVAPLT